MVDDVRLESMGESHLDATCAWLADPVLRARVDCLEMPTPERNRAIWRARWADRRREDYAIVADGRHVGNCGLSDVDRRRGKAQLWVYLGEGRGQGVGRRALEALLARAFVGLALERVYLRVLADNADAIAFYRRAGFAEEGRMRRDTMRDGQPVDALCFALLAEEYRARGEA